MIKKVLWYINKFGSKGIFRNIFNKLLYGKVKNISVYTASLRGKEGFEIGGPSKMFQNNNILPIYQEISSLDNCNFSKETIWEGTITEGKTYFYCKNKPMGHQYICDAVNLSSIQTENYDFVISSHVLEHCANPLHAVSEWLRIIKKNGNLLLVVPDKENTFDRYRKVTEFGHLLDDFNKGIREDDLSHLDEILGSHDRTLDLTCFTYEELRRRSIDNYKNRCLHHHVFNLESILKIFKFFKLELICNDYVWPGNIIALGKK
jgi:SAM-dependent methyltransferase